MERLKLEAQQARQFYAHHNVALFNTTPPPQIFDLDTKDFVIKEDEDVSPSSSPPPLLSFSSSSNTSFNTPTLTLAVAQECIDKIKCMLLETCTDIRIVEIIKRQWKGAVTHFMFKSVEPHFVSAQSTRAKLHVLLDASSKGTSAIGLVKTLCTISACLDPNVVTLMNQYVNNTNNSCCTSSIPPPLLQSSLASSSVKREDEEDDQTTFLSPSTYIKTPPCSIPLNSTFKEFHFVKQEKEEEHPDEDGTFIMPSVVPSAVVVSSPPRPPQLPPPQTVVVVEEDEDQGGEEEEENLDQIVDRLIEKHMSEKNIVRVFNRWFGNAQTVPSSQIVSGIIYFNQDTQANRQILQKRLATLIHKKPSVIKQLDKKDMWYMLKPFLKQEYTTLQIQKQHQESESEDESEEDLWDTVRFFYNTHHLSAPSTSSHVPTTSQSFSVPDIITHTLTLEDDDEEEEDDQEEESTFKLTNVNMFVEEEDEEEDESTSSSSWSDFWDSDEEYEALEKEEKKEQRQVALSLLKLKHLIDTGHVTSIPATRKSKRIKTDVFQQRAVKVETRQDQPHPTTLLHMANMFSTPKMYNACPDSTNILPIHLAKLIAQPHRLDRDTLLMWLTYTDVVFYQTYKTYTTNTLFSSSPLLPRYHLGFTEHQLQQQQDDVDVVLIRSALYPHIAKAINVHLTAGLKRETESIVNILPDPITHYTSNMLAEQHTENTLGHLSQLYMDLATQLLSKALELQHMLGCSTLLQKHLTHVFHTYHPEIKIISFPTNMSPHKHQRLVRVDERYQQITQTFHQPPPPPPSSFFIEDDEEQEQNNQDLVAAAMGLVGLQNPTIHNNSSSTSTIYNPTNPTTTITTTGRKRKRLHRYTVKKVPDHAAVLMNLFPKKGSRHEYYLPNKM